MSTTNKKSQFGRVDEIFERTGSFIGTHTCILFFLILCIACCNETEETKEDEEDVTEEISIQTESGISGECTWILTQYCDHSNNSRWDKLTISGNGDMEDYNALSALDQWRQVDTIIINEGVTSIGNYSFPFCTRLKHISIPNSVIRIGSRAFHYAMRSDGSSIISVTIPEGVIYIGEQAFKNCRALNSITVPNSVTHIGSGAFENCSELASVTMSTNLQEIGVGVFAGCNKLSGEHLSGILPDDDFWKKGKIPLELDGWYNETFKVSVHGVFSSLSFTFSDKYKVLGIGSCVYIEADSIRIYPVQQTDDHYTFDLTDVDALMIRSIHPGRDWVPYSRQIALHDIIFRR